MKYISKICTLFAFVLHVSASYDVKISLRLSELLNCELSQWEVHFPNIPRPHEHTIRCTNWF